ncbi:polysaccharide biosynthesis protein [Desulforamulus reducens MI-1]|uniref:Polysaccharide biosynthesis protein n=1 Tax=Desulforamulus reducens (strain ATCC BAA-1160 / DSM 100696 / MI-1) TaxID=349161 RepID=A4J5D3_DESRM|nr:stage V sporulation protein B [Desulforamulus reducens]ABO50286.1 polysaccharide biosynthesis protein [Desulforamulus reducens MI-1]
MSRQSFITGALILLSASFINRVIGFVYQMVIIRLIKPEGIGLFNMVFPIYILILVMATMGIPVAISKLLAEEMAKNNIHGAKRIFKISLSILFVSSVFFTVLLFFCAPLLTKYLFPNPKVYYIFLCLVPAIIVVSICSAFRGYFQGLQQMTPTAITQTLEQFVRVVSGLFIAYLLLPRGVEYAAMGAALGVVIGEFTGCLTIIYLYFNHQRPHAFGKHRLYEPFKTTISRIFGLGIPVTLMRFFSTLLLSVEAILIPQRLQAAGMSVGEATSVYGQLVGIAQTLLYTPSMITIALATALIPAIADALALENYRLVQNRTAKALRITIVVGLPCVVSFLLIPNEMCGVLFGYAESGTILAVLAIGGPFLYFQQTTTGILQGMGEAMKPFKNMAIASVFKILGLYYLTSIPHFGVLGAAASLNLGFILMALLNYIDLRKLIGYQIHWSHDIVKPVLSSVAMAIFIWKIKMLFSFSSLVTLLVALPAGCIIYVLILFLLGGLHRNDFKLIKNIINRRF